jgi:hypothetical protein
MHPLYSVFLFIIIMGTTIWLVVSKDWSLWTFLFAIFLYGYVTNRPVINIKSTRRD